MNQKIPNLFFTSILVAFTMVSCELIEPTKDETVVLTGPDLTRIVIGRGYDVTGRYAYSPEIKDAILDHDKLFADGKILEDNNLAEANFLTRSGSTITEYQSELAVSASVSTSVGVLGVTFSGEVGSNFTKSKYESDEFAFATSTSKITKTSYFVDGRRDPAQLLEYVTEQFNLDAQNMAGEDFISKYGTHVMLGAIWGARLDYHMTAKKKTTQSGTEIGAYAQARVEANFGVVSGSVETNVSVDKKFESFFETTSIEITTNAYGGSPELARAVHDAGDYNAWVESIEANPIWCDYYPESLPPIYDFIADADVKAKIKTAYDAYLLGKKIVVTSDDVAFTVTNTFTETGFTQQVGGGDKDIGSNTGRSTDYEFSIEISKHGDTELQAEISLRVKELASNYSELEGVKLVTIPVNKNIKTIDLSTVKYTKKGTIEGKTHDWNLLVIDDCPFLSDVSIRIDSDGGDDTGSIGLKGTFNIPIHYRP